MKNGQYLKCYHVKRKSPTGLIFHAHCYEWYVQQFVYIKFILGDHIVNYTGWPNWWPHIILTTPFYSTTWTLSDCFQFSSASTVLFGRFTSVLTNILYYIKKEENVSFTLHEGVSFTYPVWYHLILLVKNVYFHAFKKYVVLTNNQISDTFFCWNTLNFDHPVYLTM